MATWHPFRAQWSYEGSHSFISKEIELGTIILDFEIISLLSYEKVETYVAMRFF